MEVIILLDQASRVDKSSIIGLLKYWQFHISDALISIYESTVPRFSVHVLIGLGVLN
jgi:hypothetical protein